MRRLAVSVVGAVLLVVGVSDRASAISFVCVSGDCYVIGGEEVTVEGTLDPANFIYFGAQNPGQAAYIRGLMTPEERLALFCEAHPSSRRCRSDNVNPPPATCGEGESPDPASPTGCTPGCPSVGAPTASGGLFVALETPNQCTNAPNQEPQTPPIQSPLRQPAQPQSQASAPCGSSKFFADVKINFVTTNTAIPGLMAPTGLGLALRASGKVAPAIGRVTLLQGTELFVAGSTGGTIAAGNAAWLGQGLTTWAASFIAVGLFFEAGVGIGSGVVAAYDWTGCP